MIVVFASIGLASSIVGFWLRGFISPYLTKKAENLATKEDLEGLTRLAEETKAVVTDGSWNRQRHWEVKRDTILKMFSALGAAHNATRDLLMLQADRDIPGFSERANGISEAWNTRINAFEHAVFEASLVCDRDSTTLMFVAVTHMRAFAKKAFKSEPFDVQKEADVLRADNAAIRDATRAELGLPDDSWH